MSQRGAVVLPGQTSGSGSTGVRIAQYTWGDNGHAEVGTSLMPMITAEVATQLLHWRITANDAPTGSSLIYDVKKGGSSIFPSGSGNKIVLPAGQSEAEGTTFAASPYSLAVGNKLLLDCLQIGSGNPGTQIEIQITAQVTA